MSNRRARARRRRMAGSNKFKERLSQAARNRATRERLSNNPKHMAARLAKAKSSGFDLSGYSDKEISMALQGGMFGKEDYARLTGKSLGGNKPTASRAPSPTRSAPSPVREDPANDIGNGPGIGPGIDSPITMPGFPSPVEIPVINSDLIVGGGDGSFNVDRIDANIGKRGDMTTNIGDDNTFGAGSSIGNDYSTTVGSQSFGNSLSLPRRRRAEEGAFAGLRFN